MQQTHNKSSKFFIVITAALVMFLAGCAGSGWSKPGGTEAEFYEDLNYCRSQASSVYPVVMSSGGGSEIETKCTSWGMNTMDCTSRSAAPRVLPQDMNALARSFFRESCLKAKGYSYSWGSLN